MYACGISHSSRERAASWNTTICVIMLAGGCLAITAGPVAAEDAAPDESKAAAAVDSRHTAAKPKKAEPAEPGPREREHKQSPEADGLAALQKTAPVVAIEPEPPQARRECREISITGTRFTRRECRTAEEWAQLNARRSANAKRLVRDVQDRSAAVRPLGPGEDTPNGRPSGLPNPNGF